MRFIRYLGACLAAAVGCSAQAEGGRYLTKSELRKLFEGKTWVWNDGGGYFSPTGVFVGVSGSGDTRSTTKGDWALYSPGMICFAGSWLQRSKRSPHSTTCFEHKILSGQILQKRMPEGEWYVFRHDPAQSDDQKLEEGNVTGLKE